MGSVGEHIYRMANIFKRAHNGCFAFRNNVFGPVKIEQADIFQPWINRAIRRIPGKSGACDPVLGNVEGIQHNRGYARHGFWPEKLPVQ